MAPRFLFGGSPNSLEISVNDSDDPELLIVISVDLPKNFHYKLEVC